MLCLGCIFLLLLLFLLFFFRSIGFLAFGSIGFLVFGSILLFVLFLVLLLQVFQWDRGSCCIVGRLLEYQEVGIAVDEVQSFAECLAGSGER